MKKILKIESIQKKVTGKILLNEKELNNLIVKAKENNSILLTTEKDYFRISEDFRKNINYLKIIIDIKNRNQFINEIKRIL